MHKTDTLTYYRYLANWSTENTISLPARIIPVRFQGNMGQMAKWGTYLTYQSGQWPLVSLSIVKPMTTVLISALFTCSLPDLPLSTLPLLPSLPPTLPDSYITQPFWLQESFDLLDLSRSLGSWSPLFPSLTSSSSTVLCPLHGLVQCRPLQMFLTVFSLISTIKFLHNPHLGAVVSSFFFNTQWSLTRYCTQMPVNDIWLVLCHMFN